MKKLFTLALIMLVAAAGYSQVKKVPVKSAILQAAQEIVVDGSEISDYVAGSPNMLREDSELDYTTYDWQTNTASRNLTMNFPDGCVGFAYTIATDEGCTDRGTNIAIYHPDTEEWMTTQGKIESTKTGFGCAARYGENGIVVVSRDASNLSCSVYIIEDKDNLPESGTVEPIVTWPQDDHNNHFPAVMCTGPNHDHIHILFTAYNYVDEQSLKNPFFYYRSMDGGETWEESMTIDYLGKEYYCIFGSGQDAYFMENTGGNELNIIVNTRRGDGVVLTSTDEGDTWTRTEYYHHPGSDVTFGDDTICCYPRWTSALWDNAGTLHIAYEWGGQTGDSATTSYYPGMGGVAYWSSIMPYRGDTVPQFGPDPTNPMPMTPGEPFIMDSAYIYNDIYSSWWLWSDAPHHMWPEYIGYVTPLDTLEQPIVDVYDTLVDWTFQSYISGSGLVTHGHYNCGVSAMPVLLMTPNEELMVAVWLSIDDHNIEGGQTNDMTFFKLFARGSYDKGETWTPMINLIPIFEWSMTEFAYPQAAITGNTLVVAVQTDGEPDSYTIGTGGDADQMDNLYTGFTFNLRDLFPGYTGVKDDDIMEAKTTMTIYPNPANDVLNITLNQNEEVVIYSLTGQAISSFQGCAGQNTYNVSNLSSGVYFISAGSVTHKFIVK